MLKIVEKLHQKNEDIFGQPPVTIAFLGDSVTHGCFEVFADYAGNIQTVFEEGPAYRSRLKNLLLEMYPRAAIQTINAGLSGGSAPNGLERLARDVLCHRPDLTVVCFGLNDCMGGLEGLPRYRDALTGIFRSLAAAGSEIILMTPNMMNTEISRELSEQMRTTALATQQAQREGVLDRYVATARECANQAGIRICDCYAKWKRMYENGVDITALLANRINHPTRSMHELFARSLLEIILFE